MSRTLVRSRILNLLQNQEQLTDKVMEIMGVGRRETMDVWINEIVEFLYHDIDIMSVEFSECLQPDEQMLIIGFIKSSYNSVMNSTGVSCAASHNVYII